ncbi:Uncharacterized protein Adt_00612 [Abeliophyllum distichum]|uniref:Uncharacterized protein n=1 Tax=Abeliophyllum distichum TaxID=126358 RepID=A0ABD1RVK9_9LAMI
MDTATACFHTHRVSLFLNIQKAFDLNVLMMEAIQQFDLKSDEAEKKGLSKTVVHLSKNTDAPQLELPKNDGIMSSEDSSEEESEDVKMDIVEESEEEVDSLGCCSCFSFNLFKGIIGSRKLGNRPAAKHVEIPPPKRQTGMIGSHNKLASGPDVMHVTIVGAETMVEEAMTGAATVANYVQLPPWLVQEQSDQTCT